MKIKWDCFRKWSKNWNAKVNFAYFSTLSKLSIQLHNSQKKEKGRFIGFYACHVQFEILYSFVVILVKWEQCVNETIFWNIGVIKVSYITITHKCINCIGGQTQKITSSATRALCTKLVFSEPEKTPLYIKT